MTISAKVIAASLNPHGVRLTTYQLRYPRFIHAELMTHRVFSRNASSSRAIPVSRLIKDVIEDTAMPMHWGKNQKGMQAKSENLPVTQIWNDGGYFMPGSWSEFVCEDEWLTARDHAITQVERFNRAGYHKQIVNRLLEPFSHINVVVTSTDWANWFALRNHTDAQPEIRELAIQMLYAMELSTPKKLTQGEWHFPYVSVEDTPAIAGYLTAHGDEHIHDLVPWEVGNQIRSDRDVVRAMISTARCARVSYKTHDGHTPSVEKDIELFQRLASDEPLHASPMEHIARSDFGSSRTNYSGNFRGWSQFRKFFPNEFVVDQPN